MRARPDKPLRVYLAGRVRLEHGGGFIDEARFPGRQGRLTFACLAVERRRAVPRDELAEVVWPAGPPPSCDSALSAIVSKLRALLAETALEGRQVLASGLGCYQLHLPDDVWVDLEVAQDSLHRAETCLRHGDDLENGRNLADVASHILRRPFLPGDEGPWVDQMRENLRGLEVRADDCLSALWLAAGDHDMAVVVAERAVATDPLRESSWRHLMRGHAAAGNRVEALRAYGRCRSFLAEELGINPSPETQAVFAELLADEEPGRQR